jgi:hypothetical protein
MEIKTCCYPGCIVRTTGKSIACIHHWHSLPARVQAEAQHRLHGWKDEAAAREFVVNWHQNSIKRSYAQ